ncbi:MAG: hypothetical protein AAGE01_05390 [Pseudomonadota bacterium]
MVETTINMSVPNLFKLWSSIRVFEYLTIKHLFQMPFSGTPRRDGRRGKAAAVRMTRDRANITGTRCISIIRGYWGLTSGKAKVNVGFMNTRRRIAQQVRARVKSVPQRDVRASQALALGLALVLVLAIISRQAGGVM